MSTTFSVSRDDIITAALRGVGAIEKGSSPDTQDFTDCSFALNLLLKSWVATGMPLWKVSTYSLPVIPNLATYPIGPNVHGAGSLTADKPLRILEAFLRDKNNLDRPLEIVARQRYNELGNKFPTNSNTTYVYYLPQTDQGILTVYPPGSDSTSTYILAVQIPIKDVLVGTDVLDFPSECFQALKWNLMDEIAEDYHVSDSKIMRIERKARYYKELMENWSQEEASLYLGYDARSY